MSAISIDSMNKMKTQKTKEQTKNKNFDSKMVIEEPKKKELEKKELFVAFKREINEERNKQLCR